MAVKIPVEVENVIDAARTLYANMLDTGSAHDEDGDEWADVAELSEALREYDAWEAQQKA